jgi:GntR family transcriptional regulator/MocR family aminotransferase
VVRKELSKNKGIFTLLLGGARSLRLLLAGVEFANSSAAWLGVGAVRFAALVMVEGIAAGLHILVRLPQEIDDAAVAARAEGDGVRVAPLSRYSHAGRAGAGLLIGYGRIHERALPAAIRALP